MGWLTCSCWTVRVLLLCLGGGGGGRGPGLRKPLGPGMQNAQERREQKRRNEYRAMLFECGATNFVVEESNDMLKCKCTMEAKST